MSGRAWLPVRRPRRSVQCRPSAVPDTTRPQPPPQHRGPPPAAGCAAWRPQSAPVAEEGGATSARACGRLAQPGRGPLCGQAAAGRLQHRHIASPPLVRGQQSADSSPAVASPAAGPRRRVANPASPWIPRQAILVVRKTKGVSPPPPRPIIVLPVQK